MAKLPDWTALGEAPTPQPAQNAVNQRMLNYRANLPISEMERSGAMLQRAGDVIEQTNEKWDGVAAEDATNKLRTASINLEVDPQSGFRNVQGGNAVGQKFYTNYMDKFGQAQQAIQDTLTSDRQKQLFGERADMIKNQYMSSLLAHQSRETEVFADNTYKSGVNTELSNVAANPLNDNVAAVAKARIGALASDYAQRKGIDVTGEMTKNNDAITSARVLSLINTDPRSAQTLYDKSKDDLSANTQLTLGKEVTNSVMGVDERDLAQHLVFGNPDLNEKPKSANELKTELPGLMQQARDLMAKKYPGNPAAGDAAAMRVSAYGRQIIAQQEATQNNARDTLIQGMIGSPDGSNKPQNIDQLLSNPQAKQAWNDATPEVRLSIQDKFGAGNEDPKATPETLERFHELVGEATTDPQKFLGESFANEFKTMPHAYSMRLIEMQSAIDKNSVKQASTLKQVREIKPLLDQAGITVIGKPPAGKEYNVFVGKFSDAVDQFQNENKRQPTNQDLRKIASGLLATVPVPGRFWGTNQVPIYKADKEKIEVPDTDRQAILNEYYKHHIVPSEDQIKNIYLKGQQRKAVQ